MHPRLGTAARAMPDHSSEAVSVVSVTHVIRCLSDNQDARALAEVEKENLSARVGAFIDKHIAYSDQIVILDLSQNDWTSEIFGEFTKMTQDMNLDFSNLRYLKLDNNLLSEPETLLFWVGLPNMQCIYLLSNPMTFKNIMSIKEESEEREVPGIMRKIIFMGRASHDDMPVYQRFVEQGILPADWAEYHSEFYRSSLYNGYNEYVRCQENIKYLRRTFDDDSASDDKLRRLANLLDFLF